MSPSVHPLLRLAAFLFCGHVLVWGALFFRWMSFGAFGWQPLPLEMALSQWPPLIAYLLYGGLALLDGGIGATLLKGSGTARYLAMARAAATILAGLLLYLAAGAFYAAVIVGALGGLLLVLLLRSMAGALTYPAAFWIMVFFIIPLIIVFVVSLGERDRLGTIVYPPFQWDNLGVYFNDYVRFFTPIGGDYIYLRIFGRSLWLAILNTLICLAVGYPFAYWIVQQPLRWRAFLIFLVMVPFWTNFLVRTYAWMLILRDSGVINNFWTITLHQLALSLAGQSQFFAWLATITENRLPLLFNQPAVLVGLFYGYLPFMILPLYANMEKLDWSLLEAAADLGAGTWHKATRILLPLTLPGIAAGSIIVFIPSLGAYVTPDLMGGARVALIGNILQQQFMTVRDWPFGSAIGFILMAIMLLMTLLYFRIVFRSEQDG